MWISIRCLVIPSVHTYYTCDESRHGCCSGRKLMPVSHVCAVIVVVAVTWSVCAHLSARRDVSFTCCVHGHPIAVERLALPCDMCAEHDVCCCGVRGACRVVVGGTSCVYLWCCMCRYTTNGVCVQRRNRSLSPAPLMAPKEPPNFSCTHSPLPLSLLLSFNSSFYFDFSFLKFSSAFGRFGFGFVFFVCFHRCVAVLCCATLCYAVLCYSVSC